MRAKSKSLNYSYLNEEVNNNCFAFLRRFYIMNEGIKNVTKQDKHPFESHGWKPNSKDSDGNPSSTIYDQTSPLSTISEGLVVDEEATLTMLVKSNALLLNQLPLIVHHPLVVLTPKQVLLLTPVKDRKSRCHIWKLMITAWSAIILFQRRQKAFISCRVIPLGNI